MRRPVRASVSAILALLALVWAGVPAEGAFAMGLALGWIIAATWPDRHERVVTRRTPAEYLLFFDD